MKTIDRRGFLKGAAAGAAALSSGAFAADSAKQRQKPAPQIVSKGEGATGLNVLVITVDTLRLDHVGCYGLPVGWIPEKRQAIQTPNLDRLAQRAAVFDRHYIGSFPTVPMRTDCFTGNVIFPRYDWKKLGAEEILLTEVLREAGYYGCMILDTTNMISTDFPRGFDEFHKTYNPPADKPKAADITMPAPKENYRQGAGQRNSQLADMAHFQQESDWWVAQTMAKGAEWLKENGARDKWFLWLDTFEVHEVWNPPKPYIDLYDPNFDSGIDYDFPNYGYTDIYTDAELHHMWARYAGEVTLTDRWIGRVLDELDAQNLWEKTIVVVQSDHGMYIGEHKRAGKHTVDRADPWPIYEEVGHVPHLVWAPIEGLQRRIGALTQHADLMPTILEGTGVRGPKMHGRSYWPVLAGETGTHWRRVFSSWNSPPDKEKFTVGRLTAISGRWAYVAREQDRPAELYDLRDDPKQQNDLIGTKTAVAEDLQKSVVDFMRQQGAAEDYVNAFA